MASSTYSGTISKWNINDNIISCKPPFDILGDLANPMIKRKLKEIFDYRSKVLSDIFN